MPTRKKPVQLEMFPPPPEDPVGYPIVRYPIWTTAALAEQAADADHNLAVAEAWWMLPKPLFEEFRRLANEIPGRPPRSVLCCVLRDVVVLGIAEGYRRAGHPGFQNEEDSKR